MYFTKPKCDLQEMESTQEKIVAMFQNLVSCLFIVDDFASIHLRTFIFLFPTHAQSQFELNSESILNF